MYDIEIKRPAKSGYFYPSEAQRYYGGYSRSSITVHWWGGGEPASKHDSIVNYFLKMAVEGRKSVNYVASDLKLTEMVPATDVAWTNGGSSNRDNITIEFQPTLSAEGYKKGGWLIWQLRVRFGKYLPLYPHSKFYATQCPGTISLDRLEQEAQKWARGEYNPKPQLPEWEANLKPLTPVTMYTTKDAPLVKLTDNSIITRYGLDTPIEIGAETTVSGTRYLVSVYSFNKRLPNAIPAGNLKPTPTPTPPTPTPQPEWVNNLQNIDDTTYYLKETVALQDITTGKDVLPIKPLLMGETFIASAKTKARGTDYAITEYSYQKKIFNGVPLSSLTLLPPVPVPPAEPPPPPAPVNPNQSIIDDLKDIIARLWAIIAKLGG